MNAGLLLAGGIVLAGLTLALHRPAPPAPPLPPTPAALAFRAEQEAAAARAARAREEAARLAAVTTPAETPEVLPAGAGREETFGYCTPCHNTAVIRRSRLSRENWDGLMDWMTEKHGMNPLEGGLRTTIVDYLAGHFGTGGGRARGRNPFLN